MEQYEHLRALLTLETPTCQICREDIAELNTGGDNDGDGGGNNAKRRRKIRLVPMPYCKCRTTLASAHVDPSTWLLPDTNSNTCTNPASYLEALLRTQPCRFQQSKTKKSFAFVTTHDNLATCMSCLPAWIQSASHVTKYDYHGDPNGNEMKFTNDVRCAQCHRVFARRTVDRLLEYGGGGGGDDNEQDEWTRCVEATSRVVEWADGVKEWVRHQLMGEEGDSDSSSMTPEQGRLRSVLLSVVQADGSGMDGDGIHRLEVQHGEVKRELMQRDPKFAQEVEDMEYVRKLAAEEAAVATEDEQRQAEADERLARELAEREKEGGGEESAKSAAAEAAKDSAPTTSSLLSSYQKQMRQQQEEEKKSEELARKMQEEWEGEERRERARREKRDAKLARKLHNANRREKLGENKRKGFFDAQPGRADEFVGKAAVADVSKVDAASSDDEYVRTSPPANPAKKTATPKASKKQSAKSTTTTEAEVLDLANSSSDEDEDIGNTNDKNGDNDADEPILCTQAETSPTVPAPLSTRKRPPPASPTSNGSAKKRPVNDVKSTPRHRSVAADNAGVADFSADKKKMEEWDEGNDTDLQYLVDMGYNWREAKACYMDADLNVEKAAAMLSSALEERERAKKLRG